MDLEKTIEEAKSGALAEIDKCNDSQELERIEIAYLGRKGKVRELFSELPKAPPDRKPHIGVQLNELKNIITQKIESRKATIVAPKTEAKSTFDTTLPGKKFVVGKRHPVYKTMEDIEEIFIRLGFDIVYGPEIETQYNNFEALNIPLDHPSRDAFDTFYLAEHDKLLLRSHTSPVQIRTMLKQKPPIRIIAPGKVFRPDTPDASHSPMFHQVEGLMVGEDVTFANLKGVLELFAREMFGADTKMRFRPSFFPFTEPSAEVDISCLICLPAPQPLPEEQTNAFYVYVIECEDSSHYIGQTDNLQRRWIEHQKGMASWTKRHKPLRIVHYETFSTREEAVKRESNLKTGFGRKWLKNLVASGRAGGGKGCSACKNSGWMEILGSGMVHPNVFRAVGYDPEKYTGFAFGMGVERIAMLRHRITDIRLFTENRYSFLKQF